MLSFHFAPVTKGKSTFAQVRRLLQNEMEKSYDTGVAGDDKRERREEMERMREHIYKVKKH